jgi:anti-sigma factor ChrR (cupin superfamily)
MLAQDKATIERLNQQFTPRNVLDSKSLPWIESPFPGVSLKVLRVGEDASQVVDLTRITKGAALPPHRHLLAQRAYFLSGIGQTVDGITLEAGSYGEGR